MSGLRPRSAAAHARPIPAPEEERRIGDGVLTALLLLVTAGICLGVELHAALLFAIGSAAAAVSAVLDSR